MNIVPLGIKNVLSHKDYSYFIAAQIVVVLGFWMQNAASAWLIYSLTGSGVLLGFSTFFFLAPSLFLAPIGGLIADKFTKKHVLYYSQTIAACSTFLVAILTITDNIQVWNIMLHSAILGSVMSIEGPSRNSFMIELVGKEDLQNAIALNSSIFNLGKMLGPALSGFLITVVNIGTIYSFTGMSFLLLCFALYKISVKGEPSEEENDKGKHSILDGFIYAYKEKSLFYALILVGITSIAVTPASVLLPIIAVERLGGESMLYGLLSSSTGFGAFLAALFLASRVKHKGSLALIILGTLCITLGTLTQALSTNLYISIVAFFAVGIGQVMQVALINSFIQTTTPNIYRGRVISLLYVMWLGIGVFGTFTAGSLNDFIGIKGTLLTCFSILLFACIFILPNLTKHTRQKYSD